MLVAMYEGHFAFDRVPGFKQYAQQLAWQRRRFQKKIKAVMRQLGIAPEQQEHWAREFPLFSADELAGRTQLHKEGMDIASQRLQIEHDKDIHVADRECNDALTAYRKANEAHRPTTSPSPDHFKEAWKPDAYPPFPAIEPIDLSGFDAAAVEAALRSHRAKAMKTLHDRAANLYNRVANYVYESNKNVREVNRGQAEDDAAIGEGGESGAGRNQAGRNGVTNEEGS